MNKPYRRDARNIQTSDGVTLHFQTWGSGDQTCLLLHGFGEGRHVWSDFAQVMPASYTSIAIDFRGHGDSMWAPGGQYSSASFVDDVLSTIAKLGIGSLTIIGHSMGAEIALKASVTLGHRLAGLVIVDFGPELAEDNVAQARRDFEESLRPYRSVDDYVAYIEEKRFLPTRAMLMRLARDALKLSADGMFRHKCDPSLVSALDEPLETPLLWELVKAVSCPTLVVRGFASAILSPSVASRMKDILGATSFQQVNLAGHAVMTDNPEGFAAAVLPFLTEISKNSK